jgi:hypothetical protein
MKDFATAIEMMGVAVLSLAVISGGDALARPAGVKGPEDHGSRKARIERAERSLKSPGASSRMGRLKWGKPAEPSGRAGPGITKKRGRRSSQILLETTPTPRAKRTRVTRRKRRAHNYRKGHPRRSSRVRKSRRSKRYAGTRQSRGFPDMRRWSRRIPRRSRTAYGNDPRIPFDPPPPAVRYGRPVYPRPSYGEMRRMRGRLGGESFGGRAGPWEAARVRRRCRAPRPFPGIVRSPGCRRPPGIQEILCRIAAKKRKLAQILMGVQTVIGALGGFRGPTAVPVVHCVPAPPPPRCPPYPPPFAR